MIETAARLVLVYFATGFALFLLRHWRRWVPVLPQLMVVIVTWPGFLLSGRIFDDD